MKRRPIAPPPTAAARLFPLEGARRHHDDVERWLERCGAPDLRRLAGFWIEAWRACGSDVHELLHDGHPTFCLGGFALGYVNAFSSHVNVGFFLGSTLADPAGVLVGSGRFMRHVKLRPAEVMDSDALRSLLRAAYADLTARLRSDAHSV